MPETPEQVTHTQCLELLSKKAPRKKQGNGFKLQALNQSHHQFSDA